MCKEAVTSEFLQLFHVPGNENPGNHLMKFLSYQDTMPYLGPLLFWCVDTSVIPM